MWLSKNLNVIAFADKLLVDNFCHPAATTANDLHEARIPLKKIPAGDADFGDLDDGLAEAQLCADGEVLEIEAVGGEIFADAAPLKVDPLFAQSVVELDAVEAKGAIRPAMNFAIALAVAGNACARDHS